MSGQTRASAYSLPCVCVADALDRRHHGRMLTSRDVTNHHFTTTSLRRGYVEREVDVFLDLVVETLHYYEQGGRPGAQAPASPARPQAEGVAQRATRWLRGDAKP